MIPALTVLRSEINKNIRFSVITPYIKQVIVALACATHIFDLDPEINSNIAQFVRFGHILQYDGKFYAYQISQAMAGQIWEALFKDDPLNHEAGQRYLNTFLGVGGSRTPRSMYSELLGKDVCIDDLANSLIKYH